MGMLTNHYNERLQRLEVLRDARQQAFETLTGIGEEFAQLGAAYHAAGLPVTITVDAIRGTPDKPWLIVLARGLPPDEKDADPQRTDIVLSIVGKAEVNAAGPGAPRPSATFSVTYECRSEAMGKGGSEDKFVTMDKLAYFVQAFTGQIELGVGGLSEEQLQRVAVAMKNPAPLPAPEPKPGLRRSFPLI